MAILDADGMTSVRRQLGLTEEELPDDVLTDPLIGGQAETDVLAAVGEPAYAERPAVDQAFIHTAVTLLTAAYAIDTLRQDNAVTSERFSQQYTFQRAAIDLDGWAASLRDRAWRVVAPLRPRRASLGYFGLAHGRRA